MHHSKLLVAVCLLLAPMAPSADRPHKQRSARAKAKRFTAFAYTSVGLTKEGKRPVAGKTIAADPKVLPLGSRVQISGAGPWSGEYRVGDVGGAIKGNKVDIFVSNRKEALEFGRREITLSVLHLAPRKVAAASGQGGNKVARNSRRHGSRRDGRDIIAVDEVRGAQPDGSVIAAGRTGSFARTDHPGESGGSPAFARVPSFEGASAN